jgi:hypothetical protein
MFLLPCRWLLFPLWLRPWQRTGQLDLEYASSLVHPAALRLSSVAIAVALSPAVPIDRSSASSSGVHGGPGALISSPSARARKLATATDGFKLGVQSTIFNGEPINDLPLLILWDCGGFRCGLSRRRRWKSLVVASKPRVGLRYRLTLGRLCNRSPGRHAK